MPETLYVTLPEAISRYAEAVENYNSLYFSKESAQAAGFEAIVAPSSYCCQFEMFVDPANRIPRNTVHSRQVMSFHRPVLAGDYIYARVETTFEKDKKGRDLLVYNATFVNQRDEVVCEGRMINLLPQK